MRTGKEFQLSVNASSYRWAELGIRAIIVVLFSSHLLSAKDMNSSPQIKVRIDEQCKNNLRRIYELLELYLHQSGEFPSDLGVIASMARDPNVLICPADKIQHPRSGVRTSYSIVNNPVDRKLTRINVARVAIVAEKTANHQSTRFVLFYDGSVRAFNDSQFEKLKMNSFVAPAK